MPHVNPAPAVTLLRAGGWSIRSGVVEPVTSSGGCPSCPPSFAPQHQGAPFVSKAHVWSKPALTSCSTTPTVFTKRGLGPAVRSPVPNWPDRLSPQQYAEPLSMQHVCALPALREIFREAGGTAAPLLAALSFHGKAQLVNCF